ncbi:MAG: hypothetical protein LQ341_001314 [Variospora aurantia]|nr:MAG: hypothetical protein LQ341_001314 [Variospora aurantia]
MSIQQRRILIPVLGNIGNAWFHNARLADPPAPPPGPEPQKPIIAPDPIVKPDQNMIVTDDPQCTQDDGKAYVSGDGTYYKLQGFRQGKGVSPLAKDTASNFAECMEKCSQTVHIQFAARPANGGDPMGQCKLYSEEGESNDICGNDQHDYAYIIDPPTVDEKDFPNQLCTTVCPAADGMTFTTSYGETFRMDCGKRHGTTVLAWEFADSLEQCMENCGAMVPCHSVDYQARTRKKSRVKKEAAAEPPSAPDLTCSNQGFEYAVFASKNADGTVMTMDASYSAYRPETFKTAKPEVVGKTTRIGINDPTKIYDSTRASGEYVTVNHRAYLFTQEAGEYTFALPPGDDISLLWVGPEAFSGYTRANAKVERVFGSTPPPDYKQTFRKGEYVPVRIMWGNGGGPGQFVAEIKAPDGSTIIGAGTTKESPYLIGFSCDRTTAPKFPSYGAET